MDLPSPDSVAFTKPSFQAELKTFTNDEGIVIQELSSIAGVIPRGLRFRAVAAIMLDVGNGQQAPHQFMFSYDAADLDTAFSIFKAEAEKAGLAERNRILADIRRQNLSLSGPRKR